MSEQEKDKAKVSILDSKDEVAIQISAKKFSEEKINWPAEAQKVIGALMAAANISKIVYVDDLFEVVDNYPIFLGKLESLITAKRTEDLKKSLPDINFDLPAEAFGQGVKKVWDENPGKRETYLTKTFQVSKEDPDFWKDVTSKNRIADFVPNGKLVTFSPSKWAADRDSFLDKIEGRTRYLVLFDNVFKHSPAPYNGREGLDFAIDVINSKHKDSTICGLLTHTIAKENELTERRKICTDRKFSIESFFVLSKSRTERALQFADGIKKALLNSHCEVIKADTIEIIKAAQLNTIRSLENLDAYAFDHMVIDSSHREGVWEPLTLLRINSFLFQNNAKNEIVGNSGYRKKVNQHLEHARAIGRIKVGNETYDDHLSLRNQELYEGDELVNKLHSPVENGDIFYIEKGTSKGLYILVTQQCDLMIREDGKRSSRFGSLLKIDDITETALLTDIKGFNKNVLRPHFFADRFKLPYFDKSGTDMKVGIVAYDSSILVDMAVLDLSVFSSDGTCHINFKALPNLDTQLQGAWRNRFYILKSIFEGIMSELEAMRSPIEALTPADLQKKVWVKLMPNISFIDGLGLTPSYANSHFKFGIQRVKRFREPGATQLLNKYTRHLSREADEHDFAQ